MIIIISNMLSIHKLSVVAFLTSIKQPLNVFRIRKLRRIQKDASV